MASSNEIFNQLASKIGAQAANNTLKNRLIELSSKQETLISPVTGTPGSTVRIPIKNVGLTGRFRVQMDMSYTVAGSTMTISPLNIVNAINSVRVKGYDGTARMTFHPLALHMRSALRERRIDGLMQQYGNASGASNPFTAIDAEMYNPLLGTAVGAATSRWFFDIPMVYDYDANDLRGLWFTNQNGAQAWLEFDLPSSLVGDDSAMFNGGGTIAAATVSYTFTVIQEYLLPVVDPELGCVPLPLLDIGQTLEIASIFTNQNLAAGQWQKNAFPTGRSILSAGLAYYHNGTLGGAAGNKASQFQLEYGGNQWPFDRNLTQQYFIQRQRLGFDLSKGLYLFDFSGLDGSGDHALQTAGNGQVSLNFKPASSPSGNTGVYVVTESLWNNGAALGGLIV